jgi:hypothetical protein
MSTTLQTTQWLTDILTAYQVSGLYGCADIEDSFEALIADIKANDPELLDLSGAQLLRFASLESTPAETREEILSWPSVRDRQSEIQRAVDRFPNRETIDWSLCDSCNGWIPPGDIQEFEGQELCGACYEAVNP